MKRTTAIVLILCLFRLSTLSAQAVYNMANQTVTDCYGTLFDSEAGQTNGHYAHNENLTFRICPNNASRVTLNFTGLFCTEQGFDVLRIFDGPDTNSTLLGTWSGTTSPGTVVANSGCMTIHFRSDANRSCDGWEADWTVDLIPPTPPAITAVTNVSCFSNTFRITLDKPIPCDSAYASAFTLSGPGNPQVATAAAVNCTGGFTQTIELTMNPGFSDNGNHGVRFVYNYLDDCDSVWVFTIQRPFSVTDCPLEVEIISSSDTICQGGCVTLQADVTGGNPATYAYSWNMGLPPTGGPHVVCPTGTTTYAVTVTDAGPSPAATATKRIVVVPKPNAGPDRSVCQYSNAITLIGTPAFGWWTGPGIINNSAGTFHPDTAGPGTHQILYWRNGCADTTIITVQSVYAGWDEAACPNAPAWQVNGGFPAGGSWSGSGITSAGMFTPPGIGTYTVTYTAPNGCTHSKDIYVAPLIINDKDTICSSTGLYYLPHQPPGGVWSGPGITNPLTGEFNPAITGQGTFPLIYTVQGCRDTTSLFVQTINAPNSALSCPSQGIVQLPKAIPQGGYWSGRGIVDSALGTFDAMDNNGKNFNATLVYHYANCTDTMPMYVRITAIGADTLWFCENDTITLLGWDQVRRTPGNGKWSGAGIIDPDYPGKFDPSVSGPGTHTLTYVANTCSDSMVMVVYPAETVQPDTIVCQTSGAFSLRTLYPGGTWSGPGITNGTLGTFNPQITGLGNHTVYYTHFVSCVDSLTVTVEPLVAINLSPLPGFVCYSDTMLPLSATPSGGIWSGAGVAGSSFNPATAGAGMHTLYYQYGSGDCAQTDSMQIEVGEPIAITPVSLQDSICYGTYITIGITASGGSTGVFSYQWSNGAGNKNAQAVNPLSTTTYRVTVTDGCSDEAVQEITVFVHPRIQATTVQGPKVCYGDTGWVAIKSAPGKNYSYVWNTNPVFSGDTLYGRGGAYQVAVMDNNSGCTITLDTEIDGYNYIRAAFSPNPTNDCIDYLDPTIELLDNSTGGNSGIWDLGDGTQRSYNPGQSITHTYADTGTFPVTLRISNSGGCTDSVTINICVEPATTLYVPNAFTPNADGRNDQFRAVGIGIVSYRMMVFNRWGEKLFESNDMTIGWDGTYRGERVENDVYTYLIAYTDITSPVVKYQKGVVAVVR